MKAERYFYEYDREPSSGGVHRSPLMTRQQVEEHIVSVVKDNPAKITRYRVFKQVPLSFQCQCNIGD